MIKQFLTSKKFETFLWQTMNAFIILIIAFVTDMNWAYAPFLLPLLNMATKYINLTYLKE